MSPIQPTTGSGERRELAQRSPGQRHGRKQILAYILKATERSSLYLTKIYGEQFALTPLLQILGNLPPSPRDLRPCRV